MSFTFVIESSWLVCDVSSFSVCEVSVVSGLSSFFLFLNYFITGRNVGTSDVRHWKILSLMIFLSWFGVGSFLGGDIARNFIYFFFFGMSFYGVTLDLVPRIKPELIIPVATNKADIPIRCLCTTISSGAGAYDWVNIISPFLHILSW